MMEDNKDNVVSRAVMDKVYEELSEELQGLGAAEGTVVGCTIRHCLTELLERGMLNTLGTYQVKIELGRRDN